MSNFKSMNNYLELPNRTKKNRKFGINSLHDVKLTSQQLRNVIEEHHQFIDIAKLGVGSALVAPNLKGKIELYQSYNVDVYFGGTLFEKFYYQNKLDDYKRFMNDNNINMVEISTGTIDINIEERINLVKDFKKDFIVLSEVGTKDSDYTMSFKVWLNEIHSLLDAGCEYVITEGRNSGTAGIYSSSGELRKDLIDEIIANVDVNKIIFEAPTAKSQMFFINKIGANVNLGNINPLDLLLLEAQRVGLRSETFFIK